MTAPRQAAQTIDVYRAADLTVVNGANLGDALSFAEDLDLDDVYELRRAAQTVPLSLAPGAGGTFSVAADSTAGRAGAAVHLDACLTMMTGNGQTTEVLVLVEVDAAGMADAVYALPLATIQPRVAYALVGIDREGARQRYAEMACVSFTRGTRITMASGAQTPVEKLQTGDRVLTRDAGVQQLRWIGQSTKRAVGAFAPVRIRAGTLHNTDDLLVSPDHRLFIYQRSDAVGAGRAEVLVRARHLVNGTSVTHQQGGFVDYFQLLFDAHQIIYAEGIAAETLLVDTRTRGALPEALANRSEPPLPEHHAHPHLEFEIDETLLRDIDAADLLRRASTR